MKKYIKGILAAAVILMLLPQLYFSVSYASAPDYEYAGKIRLDRDSCFFDKGRLMIPLRDFCEAAGAAVDWDCESKIAAVYYKSETCKAEVLVFIGSKPRIDGVWDKKIYTDVPAQALMKVYVNGSYFPVFSGTPAVIINGIIYIPADILTEIFGAVIVYGWHTIDIEFTEAHILETTLRETEMTGMVSSINKARLENGLLPLRHSMILNNISSIKARDRAEYKYFGHVSPKLGSPADMFRNITDKFKLTGECLYYCSITVPYEQALNAWLESPGHRAVIMNEHTRYIGVYRYTDNSGGIHWVLLTAI